LSSLGLDERLRAIRYKRIASRLSTVTAIAAWTVGLGLLLVIVGVGLRT